jgi:hypothetical protein
MLLPLRAGVLGRPGNSATRAQLPLVAALTHALRDLALQQPGNHRHVQLLFQFVPPLGPPFAWVCQWLSEESRDSALARFLMLLSEVIR